jgi:hypothetical protein
MSQTEGEKKIVEQSFIKMVYGSDSSMFSMASIWLPVPSIIGPLAKHWYLPSPEISLILQKGRDTITQNYA